MDDKKVIVLTGFMGSGKTAVGKLLARRLGVVFRDLDREIEQGEKMSITDIFSSAGEVRFRELEYLYLKKLISRSPQVLALGGGAPELKEILQLVQEHAIMVYIDVPEKVLLERLKSDYKRPMLRNSEGKRLSDTQLLERIRTLMARRQPYYHQAEITVRVQPDWSKTETTSEIIKRLSQHAPATLTHNN